MSARAPKHNEPKYPNSATESTTEATYQGQGDASPDGATGNATNDQGTYECPAHDPPARTDAETGEAGGSVGDEPQPIGTSGSCSDGRQRPWELGPPDEQNPGLEEADQEQIIHVTARNVLEKQQGKGTGKHKLWAEDILNPPIDPGCQAAQPGPPLLRSDGWRRRAELPTSQSSQRKSADGAARKCGPIAADHGNRRHVRFDGTRRISVWHWA